MLVNEARSNAGPGSGNHAHPFTRGEPFDRPLPRRRGKSIRILKNFLDATWLAQNPQYNTPAFVASDAQEGTAISENEEGTNPVDPNAGGEDGDYEQYGDDGMPLLHLKILSRLWEHF